MSTRSNASFDEAGFTVGTHRIGAGEPPLVIAEVSANHNQDLARALAIVDAVAESGAQAVKFQTYRADTITIDADGPQFRISDDHELWGHRRLYDLYEQAHTPWEWHDVLFKRAREVGLIPFSSPFDPTAVKFLEELDCEIYKVASAELVDLPLIRAMAATGKPLIMSTGMATLQEIGAAITAARQAACDRLVLLACTSSYPALPEDANLASIPVLRDAFDVVAGLSDHTRGIGVSVAAVALGARVIEKHVTLDRLAGGVDAEFSLEPAELAQLVRESRAAARSVGQPHFGPRPSEAALLRLRRSLYVVADVQEGDEVTHQNVRSIRPAGGLPCDDIERVLGRRFKKSARLGTPMSWDLV